MSSNHDGLNIWLAGAGAAFTVDLMVYPLDTIKTRIQSPDYRRLFVNHTTGAVNKRALIRGLYQGVGSVILATLPSSGAFFTTYEAMKVLLHQNRSYITLPLPLVHASASAVAELVSCAILTPAEVIKQNAQMVQQVSSGHSSSALRQTLGLFRGNPLLLWRGYGILASRNLPFTALQFPLYEHFRQHLTNQRKTSNNQLTLWDQGLTTAISAGIAGAIAATAVTPIDVVKTRIMLSASEHAHHNQDGRASNAIKEAKILDAVGAVSRASSSNSGTMQVFRQILQEYGWTGLFRGGLLRCFGTMISSGIYLGAYETGRAYLIQRERL